MRPLLWPIAIVLAVAACGRAPASPAPQPGAAPGAPVDRVVDLAEGVTVCEVEMSGRVQRVVSGNRAIIVYTGIGDCLAEGAQIIDRTAALGDGVFFAEVFVPCGTRLTLCAAIEAKVNPEKAPLPTRHYGKLDRTLIAEGVGEIEFSRLEISVLEGAERRFPTPSRALRRPADRPMRPGHPLGR